MRAVLLLLVSSVVAGLSACSTMPTTTFDTVAGQHIKKIAIAPIGVAEKADVRIMQPVGANFGLVGALVEEGRAANARAELAKTLSAAGYDYHEDVKQTLLREFSENGFEPILLPGDRASNERLKFLAKLPTDTGSDAILDFVVSYIGFVAAGATTEYRRLRRDGAPRRAVPPAPQSWASYFPRKSCDSKLAPRC